jgi:flagellar protein FliO/FliZ
MNTVFMIGRLLVSLAAVLGLMWFIGRRMRKGGRAKSTQLIDVLGRQQLSRSASVAVVRVGEQALVVGVTDAQVSVLAETDLGAALAMTAAAGEPRTSTARRTSAPRRAATPPRPAAARHSVADDESTASSGPLTGSALSPQTWRQTLDSLRELTARQA